MNNSFRDRFRNWLNSQSRLPSSAQNWLILLLLTGVFLFFYGSVAKLPLRSQLASITDNLITPEQKQGLAKKLGLLEKDLRGEVMTAFIDTKNGGEILKTDFFDETGKKFYRLSNTFKGLDKKQGKILKIKARVHGNVIEDADVLQEQPAPLSSIALSSTAESSQGIGAFQICPLASFPGWLGRVKLVASKKASSNFASSISSKLTSIAHAAAPPSFINENSTLVRSSGGLPYTGPASAPVKTLIIVTDFADKPVAASDSQLKDAYFSATGSGANQSVASFYSSASNGRVTFTSGDLVRVKLTSWLLGGGVPECFNNEPYLYWGSDALDLASVKGVKFSNYDLISFVFPDGACQGTQGVAYHFSKYSFIFTSTTNTPSVTAHEFGHNFGLQHSLAALGGVTGFDKTDIMGKLPNGMPPIFAYFNSVHTRQFNWYPDDSVSKAQGTYRIVPISNLSTSEPKIIKVPEIFPWLISYRTFDGLDANLSGEVPSNSVYLHAWNQSHNCSLLVGTASAGQSMQSDIDGRPVSVDVLSTDSSYAYIKITSTPYQGQPSIRITDPADGKETVPRNDLPVSFAAVDDKTLSRIEVRLDQADTGMLLTQLNVTRSYEYGTLPADISKAPLGQHLIIAKAIDNEGHSASSQPVTINITTTPQDNIPPTLTILEPANGSQFYNGTNVYTSVTDNVAVEKVVFTVDGAWPGGFCGSGILYSPPYNCSISLNPGTHTVTVKAYDTTGNATVKSITLTGLSDTEPPKIKILSPINGSIVTPGSTVTFKIRASDNVSAYVVTLVDGVGKDGFPYSSTHALGFCNTTYVTSTPTEFSCSWTVPPTVGLTHYLRAWAYSGVGLGWDKVFDQVAVGAGVAPAIDSTPPALIFTSPIAGSSVKGSSTPVAVFVSDDSKITEADVFQGQSHPLWYFYSPPDIPPYQFNYNLTLINQGPITLYAKAYDIAGNEGVTTITFNKADITPPTIRLPWYLDGQSVRGNVDIWPDISDNIAGTRGELFLDGTLVAAANDLNCYASCNFHWVWNSDLSAEGPHIVTANAYDAAGNMATATPITIKVDRTGPVISFVSPVDGGAVSGTMLITLSLQDPAGIANVWYSLDNIGLGVTYTAPFTFSLDTTKYSNGLHTLTANAFDKASPNNSSIKSISVRFGIQDTTPPSITNVAASSITSSGATISWTTNESADTQVEYGPTTAYGYLTTLNSTLSLSHTQSLSGLTSGILYHFRVKSRDASGNLGVSGDLTFTTLSLSDITPPSTPTSLGVSPISCSQVNLSWGASTDTGGSGLKGYNVYVWRNSTWTFLKQVLAPATSASDTGLTASTVYYYAVSAVDNAMNQSGLSSWVSATTPACTTDTTPPTVAILIPTSSPAITTTSSVVTISSLISDDRGIATSTARWVNGATGASGSVIPTIFGWAAFNVPLAIGKNPITVSAQDTGGNTGADVLTVTRMRTSTITDMVLPVVGIIIPTSAPANNSIINLAALISDDKGITASTARWVNGATGASGVMTQTVSGWTASNVTLALGANHVTVSVQDTSGNTGADTVVFSNPYTTLPTVGIYSPTANACLPMGNTKLGASASGLNGISKAEFYVDATKVGEDTTDPYELTWNQSANRGTWVFQAKAFDRASPSNSAMSPPVYAYADGLPPGGVAVTSPAAGASVRGTITISATASDACGMRQVNFYRDSGTYLGAATVGSSFNLSVNTASPVWGNGAHTIWVRAYDKAGYFTTSSAVTVNVGN